jgi:Ca-activated chloride channel family protein
MNSIEHQISEDDPIVTAYVLGELEGEDLARVEDALARDPALRVSIDRIRLGCGAISEALALEKTLQAGSGPVAARAGKRQHSGVRRKHRPSAALFEYPGLYFVVGGLSAACFTMLVMLQRPEPGSPSLAGTQQYRRVITQLPSEPQAGETVAKSQVVEELPEELPPVNNPAKASPVPEGLAQPVIVATLPASEPATGPAAGTEANAVPASSPAATASAAAQPTPVTEPRSAPAPRTRSPFEPTLQLPNTIAVVTPSARAPLFEGFGAGGTLRTFEAESDAVDRGFVATATKPVSELGVRVEGTSFAQVRRALLEGRRPSKASVRIEQLLNSFSFVAHQSQPESRPAAARAAESPLVATEIEYAPAPWNPANLLVRVAVQARVQPIPERPAERVLVLAEEGMPADVRRMLAEALRGMTGRLRPQDRVILGRLGGGVDFLCNAEAGAGRWDLQAGIDALCDGGGSTGGQVSEDILREAGQATRVIVCTTGQPRLPEALATGTAPLAVLSLGGEPLTADTLLSLSRRGSFRSDRADSVGRTRELLMEQAGSPDPVVARRTLLAAEFNPRLVSEYRVIGYEGEASAYAPAEASELLAGQSFTALYELVPTAAAKALAKEAHPAKETLFKLKVSYEDTQRRVSRKHQFVVLNGTPDWDLASDDFRFSAAVAAMGMIMRDSPHRGTASLDQVGRWASGRGVSVPAREREEFSLLLDRAKRVF